MKEPMTVAVTGVAGFIGCNVARHLLEAGYSVMGIDDLSLGLASNVPSDIPLLVGDAGAHGVWRDMPQLGAVVHLAGASSTPLFNRDLVDAFGNNTGSFLRLLEKARINRIPRVIYASTSLIYGNTPLPLNESGSLEPLNFYALSKYTMEAIAQMYESQFGIACTGLRFMSVYGPREDHKREMANLVSQFIWAAEAGKAPVVYGDGSQTRDFTSVWDVAQAIELILRHPDPLTHRIFNVGTGQATALNQLLRLLSQLMGAVISPEYVPVPSCTPYNQYQLASLELIEHELGYKPSVTLEQGIEEILALRGLREEIHRAHRVRSH